MSQSPSHPQMGKLVPSNGDQFREYYIPINIVKEEKKLLDEYQTDRLAQVLHEIYDDFYLMIELMSGYAERNDDEDLTYFLIAKKLQRSLDSFSKACSIIVDFKLVGNVIIGNNKV